MSCCERKCNIYYFIFSISMILVLLIWNLILTITVTDNNSAHINSFNYAPENVKTGEYITFDTNRVTEKDTITHQEGTADFIINQAGNYYIQFNTTLSVYLEHNNATVYGSTVGETVNNAYQTINLNFAVIIKAESGDVLRVKNNSGTVIELLQPNIDIIKIK